MVYFQRFETRKDYKSSNVLVVYVIVHVTVHVIAADAMTYECQGDLGSIGKLNYIPTLQ